MARVFIPPALRSLTAGLHEVDADGDTVGEIVDQLDELFPGARSRLCDADGLKPGLIVMVGNSASSLGLLQRVTDDEEVHFLPSIGGGA
jgi:molybdopterin synthase sulfur carrier subunit